MDKNRRLDTLSPDEIEALADKLDITIPTQEEQESALKAYAEQHGVPVDQIPKESGTPTIAEIDAANDELFENLPELKNSSSLNASGQHTHSCTEGCEGKHTHTLPLMNRAQRRLAAKRSRRNK